MRTQLPQDLSPANNEPNSPQENCIEKRFVKFTMKKLKGLQGKNLRKL